SCGSCRLSLSSVLSVQAPTMAGTLLSVCVCVQPCVGQYPTASAVADAMAIREHKAFICVPPDELFDPPCRANRLPGYRLFTFLRRLGLRNKESCAQPALDSRRVWRMDFRSGLGRSNITAFDTAKTTGNAVSHRRPRQQWADA